MQAEALYSDNVHNDVGNAGLGAANALLLRAETALPIGTLVRRDQLDKAKFYELHAKVRFKLGSINVAQQSLAQAETAFDVLKGQHAPTDRYFWQSGWRKMRTNVYRAERLALAEQASAGLRRCDELRKNNSVPPRRLNQTT